MQRAVTRIALTAAALVLFSQASTATLIIDDYSVQIGGTGLAVNAGGVGASASATDTSIGIAGTTGDRTATVTITHVLPALPFGDIDLQTLTLGSPILIDGNYTLNPGNFLNSNSGLGMNGFTIELVYGNLPSAVDLAAQGSRFEFEFGSGDFDVDNRTPAVFLPNDIEVSSGTGTDSASVSVSDEGIYTIDFSSYTGVDFADVTGIKMTFGGQVLTPDFVIGPVRVVPEPATALLLASGLIGLATSGRRRSLH